MERRRRGRINKLTEPTFSSEILQDALSGLSLEVIFKMLDYLPLREVVSLSGLSRHLQMAVLSYLQTVNTIDLLDGDINRMLPATMTDDQFSSLLLKCSNVQNIYGIYPQHIERRRHPRRGSTLSVPGVVEALASCRHLKGVEVSQIYLIQAILMRLPQVEILNRTVLNGAMYGATPENPASIHSLLQGELTMLRVPPQAHMRHLCLEHVEIPELVAMPILVELQLRWVRFTRINPFRMFQAPNLKVFVMKYCIDLNGPMRFLPLVEALSSANELERLELMHVPIPANMLNRIVEERWRIGAFRKLKTLAVGYCKSMQTTDIGYLIIVSAPVLQHLAIQPSLSTDALLLSLKSSRANFNSLTHLHLGLVDELFTSEDIRREIRLTAALQDITNMPCPLTDSGMMIVGEIFKNLTSLYIYNSPYTMYPDKWILSEAAGTWRCLSELILCRCTCIQLESFCTFITSLPVLEVLILEEMFPPPPKGCSHVGLSSCLGFSSALAAHRGGPIPVGGNIVDGNGDQPAVPEQPNNNEAQAGHVDVNQNEVVVRDEGIHVREVNDDMAVDNQSTGYSERYEPIRRRLRSYKPAGVDQPGPSGLQKDEPKYKDSSSQARPDEIRNSIANATPDQIRTRRRRLRRSPRFKAPFPVKKKSEPKTKAGLPRNKKSKAKVAGVDKACSTSDPIPEDDPVTWMKLNSQSLISVTIVACGISNLTCVQCPNLKHIEMDACPIFKEMELVECSNVQMVNIRQCPKVNVLPMVKCVGQLPPNNRLLFLQPYLSPKGLMVQEEIAASVATNQHVLLLQDYSPQNSLRVVQRRVIQEWMTTFTHLASDYTELASGFASKRLNRWQCLTKINGKLEDGRFEMFTDIPWLPELIKCRRNSKDNSTSLEGSVLWNLSATSEDWADVLKGVMKECREKGKPVYPYTFTLYVHQMD